MKKFKDKTQQTNDLEIEQIKNGKIKVTVRTKLNGVTPLQVIDFVLDLDQKRFRQFHPQDHKEYKVLYRPQNGMVGTIIYLKEEYENGYTSSAKARIIEAIPGKKFTLKSISPWWQPITLCGVVESIDTGTLITHQVIAGSALPILGYIYNRIIKTFFVSTENTEAIYKHVKEEYKNLERLLQE